MYRLVLNPGLLTLNTLRKVLESPVNIFLAEEAIPAIEKSNASVNKAVAKGRVVYGINTGLGLLANTRIKKSELEALQHNLVLSHAAGTGAFMSDEVVRLMIALKINSLARGFSGIRLEVINALITLLAKEVYPLIPSKGSVGASGDLAPLAHMSMVLSGQGEVRYRGEKLTGSEGLRVAELSPIILGPKEGLALLNGTQASTAFALAGLMAAEDLFVSAVVAGAMSVEAALGSHRPFDERIHLARGHQAQIDVASSYRALLDHSEIEKFHANCEKVQDPYSLRCQPQVMGACLQQIRDAAKVLLIEANAVSDNPIVFSDDDIISGGNFHAEPVAMAADNLALALAEIGALSERRTALLMDSHLSHLPPFLVNNSGVNSGFMIAQVTSAALASENKTLAHPVSVDSLPTSANQEDHVSMASFAGRRLIDMADNTAGILAVEWLAACQGIDLRAPLTTSSKLQEAHKLLRAKVPFYDRDRYFAPDLERAKQQIKSGLYRQFVPLDLLPSYRD